MNMTRQKMRFEKKLTRFNYNKIICNKTHLTEEKVMKITNNKSN